MPKDRFFDLAPLIFAIVDADGIIEAHNAAWDRYLRTPAGSSEGKPLLNYVHPADRPVVAAQLLARGEHESEIRLLRRDESTLWTSWRIQWDADEAAFYISAQELPERLEVGGEWESAAHFKAVAEKLPAALGITSLKNGKMLYANHVFCTSLGIQPGSAEGRDASVFYHNPADRE